MKLSMLFILLGILQARADVHAQGSITLNMQQTEIVKVLNKIEKKGEFRFLYNYDLTSLKKKVDVNFFNSDLKTVLQNLFTGTNLTYKILENNLVVVMAGGGVKQAIRITGTVTGPSGEPLTGVSVQVKGGTVGTSTGNKGEYSLTVDENATLVFSYIGYSDKEVAVNGKNVINVQLTAADKKLDEVVVIGYGSQRRKDLTGAVSTVTAADIANRPIVDAGEALQGKAAGVTVVSNSGKPGAGLTIRVRGSSSISAGNDPLYVVDGIPMTDISAFSPNDIESISILKDAASASIYGTRAANGVVVITTKKGVAGKSRISANVYGGISSTTKMLHVLNGKQYQDYANELNAPVIAVTDSMVAANNVDWPKEVFQKGNQQSYELSAAGGTEKTQHFFSVNYLNQKGIVKPAAFDRLTARVNLTTRANSWLTFITSNVLSHSHLYGVTDNVGVANGGVVLSALETPFTVPKYEPDGRIGFNPLKGWSNPYGAIYGRWSRFTTDRLLSNLGADVKLLKGLVFQSRFGLDYQDIQARSFVDPFLYSTSRLISIRTRTGTPPGNKDRAYVLERASVGGIGGDGHGWRGIRGSQAKSGAPRPLGLPSLLFQYGGATSRELLGTEPVHQPHQSSSDAVRLLAHHLPALFYQWSRVVFHAEGCGVARCALGLHRVLLQRSHYAAAALSVFLGGCLRARSGALRANALHRSRRMAFGVARPHQRHRKQPDVRGLARARLSQLHPHGIRAAGPLWQLAARLILLSCWAFRGKSDDIQHQ